MDLTDHRTLGRSGLIDCLLAARLLTDKDQRLAGGTRGEGRLAGPNPFGDDKFTEQHRVVLDALRGVVGTGGSGPGFTAAGPHCTNDRGQQSDVPRGQCHPSGS